MPGGNCRLGIHELPRGNQHAKKSLFSSEVAGLAREMMILSSYTSIGGGAVCGGGGGGGEVRRHAMANNREMTSKASIPGPYQLPSSSYHLTPMMKERILYPPLPPSHLRTLLFQKNCAACTRSHRRCIFEFPGERQCTRCCKMHLTCFFFRLVSSLNSVYCFVL